MTFAAPQRHKLSWLGRLQSLLGPASPPPKSSRWTPVIWSSLADTDRPHAKSEFGKRVRIKQS
jgi:hypothetical protein